MEAHAGAGVKKTAAAVVDGPGGLQVLVGMCPRAGRWLIWMVKAAAVQGLPAFMVPSVGGG